MANNQCCLSQFYYAYLPLLGFDTTLGVKSTAVLTIRFNPTQDRTHIGCYGIALHSSSNYMYKHLKIVYQKTQVFKTVSKFCEDFDLDYDFMPLTFSLNDTEDRITFFKHLPCDGVHWWVFKTNVHQGKGMLFFVLFPFIYFYFEPFHCIFFIVIDHFRSHANFVWSAQ